MQTPWHTRRVTHRHSHEHQSLLQLHLLTHAWVGGTQSIQSHIPNPFEKEPTLEDDTSPDEVLARLEAQVRLVQLKTLETLLHGKSPLSLETLEGRSHSAGQEAAAKKWHEGIHTSAASAHLVPTSAFAPIGPEDKRPLVVAVGQSPMAARMGTDAFLVRRATLSEVCIEMRVWPYLGTEGPDTLRLLHYYWLKGYLQQLNPALAPDLISLKNSHRISW